MNRSRTLVIGIGSPHGDDQAGWLVAERIARDHHAAVRQALSPADVLDWLQDVDRLIICDACRGLGRVGEVRRWQWPLSDMPLLDWSGTHDVSLPAALELADRLGLLPRHVVIWAVEGEAPCMLGRLSPQVADAVPRLVDQIAGELCKTSLWQGDACTSSR